MFPLWKFQYILLKPSPAMPWPRAVFRAEGKLDNRPVKVMMSKSSYKYSEPIHHVLDISTSVNYHVLTERALFSANILKLSESPSFCIFLVATTLVALSDPGSMIFVYILWQSPRHWRQRCTEIYF